MQRIPAQILRAGNRLFWDVDASQLDPAQHEDFIFGRVLSDGNEAEVRALHHEVGTEALRHFLSRAPHRLDARTRRFLEVVLDAARPHQQEPCTTKLFLRSNSALFSP
jgi:hypothetical protein